MNLNKFGKMNFPEWNQNVQCKVKESKKKTYLMNLEA